MGSEKIPSFLYPYIKNLSTLLLAFIKNVSYICCVKQIPAVCI